MGYHLDLSEQIRLGMVDPDEPGDMEAEWASEVGYDDGYAGGVSVEGRDALSSGSRSDYIEMYWEGFTFRKERALGSAKYTPSFEGAGEMFMPRTDPHHGWTDTYTKGAS